MIFFLLYYISLPEFFCLLSLIPLYYDVSSPQMLESSVRIYLYISDDLFLICGLSMYPVIVGESGNDSSKGATFLDTKNSDSPGFCQ